MSIKHIGITKKVDNLGRLTIPKEIREMYHLEEEAELVLTDDGVLLRNPSYTVVRTEDNEK